MTNPPAAKHGQAGKAEGGKLIEFLFASKELLNLRLQFQRDDLVRVKAQDPLVVAFWAAEFFWAI